MIVVVMGVSGSGKSQVGERLAALLDWRFAEGDAFHPEANRAKMAAGDALGDADRWPWLQAVAAWMLQQDRSAAVACSALRRPYRDLLRGGGADVRFLHLLVPEDELDRRLRTRAGHFMPASLLASQLSTLEPLGPDEPGTALAADGASIDAVAERAAALVRGWLDQGPGPDRMR